MIIELSAKSKTIPVCPVCTESRVFEEMNQTLRQMQY